MALYRSAHLGIITFREPDLEMMNANMLTKIHDDYINKQDKIECL